MAIAAVVVVIAIFRNGGEWFRDRDE